MSHHTKRLRDRTLLRAGSPFSAGKCRGQSFGDAAKFVDVPFQEQRMCLPISSRARSLSTSLNLTFLTWRVLAVSLGVIFDHAFFDGGSLVSGDGFDRQRYVVVADIVLHVGAGEPGKPLKHRASR